MNTYKCHQYFTLFCCKYMEYKCTDVYTQCLLNSKTIVSRVKKFKGMEFQPGDICN